MSPGPSPKYIIASKMIGGSVMYVRIVGGRLAYSIRRFRATRFETFEAAKEYATQYDILGASIEPE